MKSFSVLILFILHNAMCNGNLYQRSTWADYRSVSALSIPSFYNESKVECKQPGLTCGKDCVSVYLCKKTAQGYKSVLAETCNSWQTCSAGTCSSVPSHECSSGAKYPYVCTNGAGVFPDPADCRKYHFCVPNNTDAENGNEHLIHYGANCSTEYIYNPRTTYCDIPYSYEECSRNMIPVCRRPAQTGWLNTNRSVYYICLPYSNNANNVLYPFQFVCPNGSLYNGNYECVFPNSPEPGTSTESGVGGGSGPRK